MVSEYFDTYLELDWLLKIFGQIFFWKSTGIVIGDWGLSIWFLGFATFGRLHCHTAGFAEVDMLIFDNILYFLSHDFTGRPMLQTILLPKIFPRIFVQISLVDRVHTGIAEAAPAPLEAGGADASAASATCHPPPLNLSHASVWISPQIPKDLSWNFNGFVLAKISKYSAINFHATSA